MEEWTEEDGIIRWKHRIYVPVDPKLRETIIRNNHDSPLAGHPGRFKTHELVTRDFWWPGIQKDIRVYVEGCIACQRSKAKRSKPAAPLVPNEVPSHPWEIVSIDMIGPLPESKGFDAILVIVDRFTKKMEAIPTNVELTSMGTAKLFRDYVFKHHGLPRKVISDRGTQFVSKFMTDLLALLGITPNRSTTYHPQTNGQTERVNQEIEQYLRLFVNTQQDDWADWIPLAQFSYNDKVHTSTGHSPFFLNYGQHPWKGTDTGIKVKTKAAGDFAKEMAKVRRDALKSLEAVAASMKHFYDQKRNPPKKYEVGDKVLLEAVNLQTKQPMKKLADK